MMRLISDWKRIGQEKTVWICGLSFALLLAIFSAIFRPFFPLTNGQMGHDFSYVLPSWLDGHIWFKNNGLSVPWFSPSFCAGQPFFPDPQSAYFAFPQLLAIIAGPINAAYLTLGVCATLMFWGGYLLMRKVFATGPAIAVLVGGLLMFNGFLPHRLLVGHTSFHAFAFTPWLALLLLMPIRRPANSLATALIAGILLAYWVHSGFGTLILAGGLAVFLVALLHCLCGGSFTRFAARGMLACVIGLGLSAAKLWAAFSYLSNFPRTSYLLPGAATLADAVVMIAAGLFLPSQWAYEIGVTRLVNLQWGLEPHEWAYGFGIGTALLILVLVIKLLGSKQWYFAVAPRQIWLWLLLLLGMAWPLAFNFWDPTWNAFLKQVPILNSASTPLRWVIVYIPIMAVGVGVLLERARWGRLGLVAASCCLLAIVAQTAIEPRQYYLSQSYDARPIEIAEQLLSAGKYTPEISMLGTSSGMQAGNYQTKLNGNDTFIAGVSQVFCYNPIFGYKLEKFSAEGLVQGPVLAARDGFLNLKNPACYVYPKENACLPGDRFRADQLDEAKKFVTYQPYSFKISEGQKMANLVTRFSLGLVALLLLTWLCLTFSAVWVDRNDERAKGNKSS